MMQLKWRIFPKGLSLWLYLCLLLGALLPSAVSAYSVQVLSSGAGGAYDEVIESLKSELLQGTEIRVQYLSTNQPNWKAVESTNLIVAVGVDAANAAIQANEGNVPILCVLIPKVAFETLTSGKKDFRRVTAIFPRRSPWAATRTHSSVAASGQKSRRCFGKCLIERQGAS